MQCIMLKIYDLQDIIMSFNMMVDVQLISKFRSKCKMIKMSKSLYVMVNGIYIIVKQQKKQNKEYTKFMKRMQNGFTINQKLIEDMQKEI